MKLKHWTLLAAALLVTSTAGADPIYVDPMATTPPAGMTTGQAMDKAAMKAAKRAAKAEKRAAKRLAKQCRAELRRAARTGRSISAACRAPAPTVANTVTGNTQTQGPDHGNAFGQVAEPQGQGTQGNGNAYGFGQGNGFGGNPSSNLPPQAFQPLGGPVLLGEVGTPASVEVPEPATLSLMGLGLLGLGAVGRRRKTA